MKDARAGESRGWIERRPGFEKRADLLRYPRARRQAVELLREPGHFGGRLAREDFIDLLERNGGDIAEEDSCVFLPALFVRPGCSVAERRLLAAGARRDFAVRFAAGRAMERIPGETAEEEPEEKQA